MRNQSGLFLQNVFTFKNLPVQQRQRKWTDCCCTILSTFFTLILFIMSFIIFTKYNYYQVNFPADDMGVTCYHQLKDYPYMFFANPQNPTSARYCVKSCPKEQDLIQCQDNGKLKANCKSMASSYDTFLEINSIGAFCSPADPNVRTKLFSQSELGTKLSLTYGYDVIKFSILMGMLVGLLYLAVIGCFPRYMTLASFVLSFFVLLGTGVYISFRPVHLFSNNSLTISLSAILILLGIAYIFFIIIYKNQIQLGSILIHHSNNFLKESYMVFLYIPLFLFFTVAFLILIVWQFIAFGTAYQPTFETSNIYYHSTHNWFLQFLNLVELIWGMQFLRDSFNFIVSGNAVEWYFKAVTQSRHCSRPLLRLLTKHWGSIVGGSFLHGFFKIFDIFADLFNCDPKGEYGRLQVLYQKFCCCNYFTELIRSDSYSYINLTGIPYCNAARQCDALGRYSKICYNPNFSIKTYRNASHIFVIGLAGLLSYIILDSRTNQYGNYDHFWIATAIVFVCYSMGTFFVDIHSSGAQGILVSYLTEENCEGQQYMQVCPGQLRKEIYNYKSANVQGHSYMV